MGPGRVKGGSSARPYGGSSRPWRAGLRLGGGPQRSSGDLLRGDSPRQVGDRPWLEREKCPEKRTVPVGPGDVCSTVHGSYQLSTDTPQPQPRPPAAQPSPSSAHATQTRWHHQTTPCPPGTWPWLVPVPPIKPKEKKLFKSPHPQILHAILGQMNKQKLLLLTFMQNDREGDGGGGGAGLGPSTARDGQPPATQEVPLLGWAQAPPGYTPPHCSGGWL